MVSIPLVSFRMKGLTVSIGDLIQAIVRVLVQLNHLTYPPTGLMHDPRGDSDHSSRGFGAGERNHHKGLGIPTNASTTVVTSKTLCP